LGAGVPGVVAAKGEAAITNLALDPDFSRQAVIEKGLALWLCAPLRSKDQVVGVMNIADRRKAYKGGRCACDRYRQPDWTGRGNAGLYTEVEGRLAI
jgi:GAF domain-containing protein